MHSIRNALVAACVVFGAEAAKADEASNARLVEVFAGTCLATFPSYAGVESKLASLAFEIKSDKTWKDGEMLVNPAIDLSGGGAACGAFRRDTDPVEVGDQLFLVMKQLSLNDLSATRKGRRTTLTFRKGSTTAVVKVEPMRGETTSITVMEQ